MRKLIRLAFKTSGIVLLAALAGLGFLALTLHLEGSQDPPPDFTGRGTDRLLGATRKAGGMDLYPNRIRAAEDDLRRARFEMNLQLASFWGTRDFTRPQRFMDDVQRDASCLWRELSRHRILTRVQAESAIATAKSDLDQAEAILAVSAQESYVHAKLAAASIGLQRAQTYLAGGRYDQALVNAQDSIRNSQLANNRSRQAIERYDDPKHLQMWHEWIREAVDNSRATGGTSFVVVKERHVLQVYKSGKMVRSVPVDLGANAINQKLHAGDRTTPEGLYRITQRKGYGQSKYGMALLLNYPNDEDRRRFEAAKRRGELTSRTRIGGLIEIHGEGGRGVDWTDGCIAPDNRDMEVLFREASVGTMVAIVGSDGGDGPVRSALRLMVRR
jgi:L,D-peptidoglycan transpeptidase YkuD (ErfK/YbiS/YcfS/YnhG family)